MQAESWTSDARQAQLRVRRKRQARKRLVRRVSLASVALLSVLLVAVAFVYAGSPNTLPAGVEIAGVDVAGLSPAAAVRRLDSREAAMQRVPLVVNVDGQKFRVRPSDLALNVDWRGAVAEAQGKTDGFRPIRGFRRLAVWAFGTDVTPSASVDRRALARVLQPMTRGDVAHRDAAIRLVGLRPVVVPEKDGLALDPEEAEAAIVGTLASLDRTPVTLSATNEEPKVTADMLAPVVEKVRMVTSAPVRLVSGNGFTRVSKRQLARLLELPAGGTKTLRIAGPRADAYFATLAKRINTKAQDAEFVVATTSRVIVKPSVSARALDVPRTADRLLAAALRPTRRSAPMVVARSSQSAQPRTRGRWASPASSPATRRSTRATRTASTTCGSSPISSTGRSSLRERRSRSTTRPAIATQTRASSRRR